MSLQQLQDLLQQLSHAIRLPGLKADDEGYCCLSFDDKIHVHIQLNLRTDNLTLFTEIGTVNDADKDAVYPMLLQANVFWLGTDGATLGFNTKNNMVTMGHQEPIRNINFDKFQKMLQTFVDSSEKWIDRLVDIKNSTTTSITVDSTKEIYRAEDYQVDQNLIPV